MNTQNSIFTTLPVLFGFFVMGFCDIVGISSDYVQRTFNWSPAMTGFVPSLVFIWFLFLGIPTVSYTHLREMLMLPKKVFLCWDML